MSLDRDGEHVDLSLPGYVLDALDGDERHAVAAHLRVCHRCRRLGAADDAVAAQLGFAAPRRAPHPELKHRLMARVATQAGAMPPRAAAPSGASGGGGVGRGRTRALMAAAMLPWIVVVALGVLLARASNRQAPAPVVATVSGSGGLYGWLTMSPGAMKATLLLTNVPPLAAGWHYVCWLGRDGHDDRACVFRPSARHAAAVTVTASHPMGYYARVIVTMEGPTPSPRPSGTLLASGSLQ